MIDPLMSFAELLVILDLDPFTALPQSRATLAKLQQLRRYATAKDNDALVDAISPDEQEEIVRVFAACSILAREITPAQLSKLGDYLLSDSSNALRLALAQVMRCIPLPQAIDWLVQGLVSSDDPHL